MATRSRSTLWTVVLVATILVASVLRLVGLGTGLWYDEIVTLVLSARHPISEIVTQFPGVNAHPLFSVLAHACLEMFGESPWALRLPACLFGIASVVMVYVFGASLMTRAEAWAGAAVLATSYHHIWFSQNARGYTLLGFLTLFSTYVVLRAGRTGRLVDYVVYGVACVAGIYTHLTMALVVAGQAAAIFLGRASGWRGPEPRSIRSLLWTWAGVGLLSAALYAPFAASLVETLGGEAPQAAANIATARWAVLETVRSLVSGAGVFTTLAAGILMVVGAFSLSRRDPLAFGMLLLPGVLTAAAVVVLAQPMRPRFFFFLSGAAALCLGRGIGAAVAISRPQRFTTPTAAIVACTAALIALSTPALARYYRVPKQDFDGAVRFLESAEQQGVQIVVAGPACLPIETYYSKMWSCVRNIDDLRAISNGPRRAMMVYTLADYIEDPRLAENLRTSCPVIRRFGGTLGGGDLVVCEVGPAEHP